MESGDGPAAILFLHDPESEAASDFWGFWPDRFQQRGYRTLAIDLLSNAGDDVRAAAMVAARYLRATGTGKLLFVAGGSACDGAIESNVDAVVLLAPPSDLAPSILTSLVPKLIIGGSADSGDAAALKRLGRASRGWTLLSTYATVNDAETLLAEHGEQIESQIASFFQEFRVLSESNRSGTRR